MEQYLAQAGDAANPIFGFLPIILLFVIIYFVHRAILLIRPQQQNQKKREDMLSSIQNRGRNNRNVVFIIGGIVIIILAVSWINALDSIGTGSAISIPVGDSNIDISYGASKAAEERSKVNTTYGILLALALGGTFLLANYAGSKQDRSNVTVADHTYSEKTTNSFHNEETEETNLKYCGKCGSKNSLEHIFCNKCGYKLEA